MDCIVVAELSRQCCSLALLDNFCAQHGGRMAIARATEGTILL